MRRQFVVPDYFLTDPLRDFNSCIFISSLIHSYKNDYRFIDLIQSPGIAHIVNTKVDNSKEYSLFAAVIGLWPVMAITMVSVLLSGIVIWYLVSG